MSLLTLKEIPLTTSSVLAAKGGEAWVAIEPRKKQDLLKTDFKKQEYSAQQKKI